MNASARSTACPACGRGLDPLRAGQVAILDGVFRYFCGTACKAAFVETSSKRSALDALTQEPPQVREVVESGVRSTPVAFPTPFEAPPVAATPPSDRRPVPEEQPTLRVLPALIDEPPDNNDTIVDVAPSTLRSPAVETEAKPAVRRDYRALAAEIAPGIGIGAGVLASVIALAGDAATVVRLPFALVAAAVAIARAAVRPRDVAEPSAWVIVAPTAAAAIAAVVASASSAAGADNLAAFVGLSAASALLYEILATRARRDVVEARAATAAALAVKARVVRGEAIEELDASDVKPGEQVIVEAGETVAVDGIITAGAGEIAPWLDASVVVQRREGDAIVAGASLVSGRIRVTATFSGAERAWLRPARSHAAPRTAPLLAFGKRAIERGAPLAAFVVAGMAYANHATWAEVVMAACAGAFALAAVSGITAAALAHARGHLSAQRRGIVYKDAEAFDTAGRVDVAVVCSRGTILLGEPELVAIEGTKNGGDDEIGRVLALAAGAEMGSSHPFAGAILRAARARNVRPENVRSALVHAGLGVTALAPTGDKLIVGGRALLLKEKVSVAIADARVSELEAQGRSVLLVALGDRLVGLLALQDGLRPGARAAVQKLHDARIEPVLLSGEARETCETIARALDVEHVRPEILPQDRAAEVRALADGGHVIAALGHASSDDGALGAADVSVAMSAAGAAPGEWSVSLASDDVRDAALALTVPRACRERAKTAALVGVTVQALTSLGIAFGAAPAAVAPVLGILATALALALVREPVAAPR